MGRTVADLRPIYQADPVPLLDELAATPPMVRLAEVGMNCGCEYTAFPKFAGWLPYSRLNHSIGVGRIVWRFTRDPAQAAAGLLHDVATPAFAHVVDFLHGDYRRQESTEARTAAIIDGSPDLQAVLRRYGLTTADVADDHRYPIADNDSPRLSADRLEYTLGGAFSYGFLSLAEVQALYADLTVSTGEDGRPELAFRTPERALDFTAQSLALGRIYQSDEDRFVMQALADVLRLALARNVLTGDDLYLTEPEVIARLTADPDCRAAWETFRAYGRMRRSPTRPDTGYWVSIPAKVRYIDPLTVGRGRVSRWDESTARQAEALRQADFTCWLGAEPL